MNKTQKIILLILSAALAMAVFAGCGDTKIDQSKEVSVTLDAYIASISYTEKDESGTSTEYYTSSITMSGHPGQTVSAVLDKTSLSDFKLVCEDDVFEGWIVYNEQVTVDSDGFEMVTFERAQDELLSDKQMRSYKLGENNVTFVAKWKGIPNDEYVDMYEGTGDDFEDDDPYSGYYLSLIANGGVIYMGESEPYDDIALGGYALLTDETLNAAIDDKIVKVEKDRATFDGWKIYTANDYDIVYEEPKNLAANEICIYLGSEIYGYQVLKDYELYGENLTTEEMINIQCEDVHYFVIASWK